MRYALALVAIAVALAAGAPEALAQAGFDRPGGDYSSFPIRTGEPTACSAACERDTKCRAWSFSYPRTATSNAMCWLKNQVTTREDNSCCVSGVRGAAVVEPLTGDAEFAIDRVGGDYRNFEIPPDPTGKSCAKACADDNRCRAWTYLRPGYIGPGARCFLKNAIKPPRRKPCCISGVVR